VHRSPLTTEIQNDPSCFAILAPGARAAVSRLPPGALVTSTRIGVPGSLERLRGMS